MGLTGRYGNRLKIRPPLVITNADIDVMIVALDKVLGRLTADRQG